MSILEWVRDHLPTSTAAEYQYRETGHVEVEFWDGDSRQLLPKDVPAAVAPFAAESEYTNSSK